MLLTSPDQFLDPGVNVSVTYLELLVVKIDLFNFPCRNRIRKLEIIRPTKNDVQQFPAEF